MEKDVPQLNSIEKRLVFLRFLRTLAVRSGQVLNYTALAQDCGLTIRTAREWLPIIEASGFIFVLPPFFENIGKRLVRSPKLYLTDTSLLCRLMGIRAPIRCHTNFRHPFNLSWSGKTCDIRRSSKTTS